MYGACAPASDPAEKGARKPRPTVSPTLTSECCRHARLATSPYVTEELGQAEPLRRPRRASGCTYVLDGASAPARSGTGALRTPHRACSSKHSSPFTACERGDAEDGVPRCAGPHCLHRGTTAQAHLSPLNERGRGHQTDNIQTPSAGRRGARHRLRVRRARFRTAPCKANRDASKLPHANVDTWTWVATVASAAGATSQD